MSSLSRIFYCWCKKEHVLKISYDCHQRVGGAIKHSREPVTPIWATDEACDLDIFSSSTLQIFVNCFNLCMYPCKPTRKTCKGNASLVRWHSFTDTELLLSHTTPVRQFHAISRYWAGNQDDYESLNAWKGLIRMVKLPNELSWPRGW